MTASTTSIYELSRDSIIEAAMRKLGVLAYGASASSTDLTNGMQALNALIAEFQTLGMPLWARTDYTVTLVTSQADYTFGVGQTLNTPFPIEVLNVTLVHSSGSQQEMFSIAKSDFLILNTASIGRPVNYTYQPKINIGVLSVWPKPDSTSASAYTMKVTYQRPFYGYTASSETPDFPQEWQNALIYNLAVSLAPEFGVPLPDRQLLSKEAAIHLDAALQGSAEDTSYYFMPDRTQ